MNARLTSRRGWLLARRVAAAGSIGLALCACGHKERAAGRPEPGDLAVAKVNGEMVWASDVKREAAAQGLIGKGEPLDATSPMFHQVLEEVEDQKLLAAEAVRRRLEKTPDAQRRLTAARERVLGDLVLENAVGGAVREGAVKGLYAEMLKDSTPSEEIHLRQIVLGSQADAEAVKKLLAGGASFEALAAERSRDEATRFQGGVLPPLTTDMLPPEYAGPLKGAGADQLIGPFRTSAGWVVARIDERRAEAPISLDAARPQIIRFLTYDRVKDLILDLRKKAKVETLIPPLAATPGAEPASAPPPPALKGERP
ncbi:MAG: peptidylprolyl isomerase [Caulobacteraceae bacterium]